MLLRELKVWGWVLQKNTCHEIHDPFFTTKEKVTETCLGLDIACQRVVKDDGKINVSSKKGKGVTFSLTFLASQLRSTC